jgi:hypothetical protein
MPLVIKNKRTGQVDGNGVVGNSLLCGHCNQPCLEGKTWIALDEPYHCLVHETCLTLFEYNKLARTMQGTHGRDSRITAPNVFTFVVSAARCPRQV